MLDLSQPFTEGLEDRDASSSAPTARVGLHGVIEENSLDDQLPSFVTDAG